MRFKLTLFLLLANLAVFFLLWRLNQPPEIPIRPGGPIPKDMDIDRILIEDRAANSVEPRELTKDRNGAWHLVKPVEWLANDFAVTNLITHLQFLDEAASFSIENLKKSGQTPKDFGLDKAAVKVTVFSGTRSAELDIGTSTLNGNRLYVMNPADGLVRVVGQELLTTLDLPLDDLREKNPFTLPIFKVQSLSISAAGAGSAPAATFTRFVRADDEWRMDTPFSCPADADAVNRAITQLENLHAESFVPAADAADPAHLGLTAPSLKIELKGDTSQALWLGNEVPGAPEKEFYAKLADSPTVFVVKADGVFTTLLHAQDALRERQFLGQFLDFKPEGVTTIKIRLTDTAEVQMEMLENHTWQIVNNEATDTTGAPATTFIAADASIIQALLTNLRHLSAKSFASDAPTSDDLQNTFNLKTPEWKVTLQGDKATKAVILDIGISTATTPIRYFAKIEGTDSVYEIDSEIIGQLSINPLHYRDRILEKLPTGAQIVSLKLTHLTGDDLTTGDEVFNGTVDPTKTTWDDFLKGKSQLIRDSMPVVLDAVRQFTVETYEKTKFDEHYQMNLAQSSSDPTGLTPVPWRFRLDAVVQLATAGNATASTEKLTFYFSDRLKGSLQLGGTSDAPLPPAIFTLPMSMIGALGVITREQTQPAEATETLRGLDQPINPNVAAPTASGNAAPASSVAPLSPPADATAPAPAIPPLTPAP